LHPHLEVIQLQSCRVRILPAKNSKFDVDFLAVEDVSEGKIEGKEIDGVSERSPLQRRDKRMNPTIDGLGDADVAQENGEELAGNIESESVDTKNVEESGPIGFLLNINHIHQEGLEQGGEATGDHNVAGAPDALVEGETVREQIATDDENGTHHEEGDDLIRDCLFLADEFATIETKQHMGDRRDGA